MKKTETIKKIKGEIKLWEDARSYLMKKMRSKTYTKGLEKEIDYMIKERNTYLKNMQKQKR